MNYENRELMKEAIWKAAKEGKIVSLVGGVKNDNSGYLCVGMWAGSVQAGVDTKHPLAMWEAFARHVCTCVGKTCSDDHRETCPAERVANMNDSLLGDDPKAQAEVARRACKILDELELADG